MTDDELIEVLKKFETTRVENLNDNARRLFYAIMKIADEKDVLKEENQRLQLALKNSKLSHKNIIQKSKNQKEEIKRLYKQREKLWKRKAFLGKENQRLNNVLNELEKEINRLLERQYESEKFAKEQGFNTYLPAKVNLEYVKRRLNELKESDK